MTSTFQDLGGRRTSTPLKILIFASETEFAEYRPTKLSVGFYQSGPGGDWICLQSAAEARVALHEYTHLLLNRSTTRLPQWLEEGLAEFFSTLRIDNTHIVIGSAIPSHISNLKVLDFLSEQDLMKVMRRSVHDEEALLATRFYATSWALVHMLYLSPKYAPHMPRFVEAIDTGAMPPEEAFVKAFGVSLNVALRQAQAYVQQAVLPIARIARPHGGPEVPISGPQTINALEIAQIQAELLLDAGRRDQAMQKYQWISRSKSPASLTAQAFFALSENEMPKARSLFAKLIEDPQAEARVVFEYAMLLRDSGTSNRERVTELLERTIRRNSAHPEAHFLLGVRATDEKRYAAAVEHLRQAVAILPRQSSFWHALGFAQSKLGNRQEAERAATKALRIAETEQEEKMATDLLSGLLPGRQAAPAARKGDVPLPETWKNRVGDSTTTGTLVAFVCGNPPKIQISTKEGLEEFVILHPQMLVLDHTTNKRMEFACGSLEPKQVQIEYLRATRDITRIDFMP